VTVTLRAIGGERLATSERIARATAECVAEGLSAAQAKCFDDVRHLGDVLDVADCPAIRDDRPSWFRVAPGPREFAETRRRIKEGREKLEADRRRFDELRREIEEQMRTAPDAP